VSAAALRPAARLPAAILDERHGLQCRRLLEGRGASYEVRLILTDNPGSNAAAIAASTAWSASSWTFAPFAERTACATGSACGYDRELAAALARSGRAWCPGGWDWVVGPRICGSFLTVNVHPGDLRVRDAEGRRRYVGLG